MRLIVGITGHRDLNLKSIDRLRHIVREELTACQRRFPPQTLEFWSPLAEGADRLAAEAALGLGLPLIVPLPMPLANYVIDFHSKSSIQAFHRLLEQARRTVVVTSENPRSEEARVEAYRRCGEYVADHCHVLLALWDGGKAEGPGGTAEIVAYKLGQYREPEAGKRQRAVKMPGMVVHILTPRYAEDTPSEISVTRHYSVGLSPEDWEAWLRRECER